MAMKVEKMDVDEYYKNRLEHTLRHMHEATKAIYLVDGAILIMIYFVLGNGYQLNGIRNVSAIILFVLLGVINIIHAGLLMRQVQWYYVFDDAWLGLLGKGPNERPKGLRSGTLYVLPQVVIAAAAFIAAIAMIFCTAMPTFCKE